MSSFAKWMTDQDSGQDPNLKALQDLARHPASKWPYWSNTITDYINAIEAIDPPPQDVAKRMGTLADYFFRWTKASEPPPPAATPRTFADRIFENIGIILPSIAAIIFMLGIFYGLANSDFYSSLSRTEQGRGLITFVFALTATAVILLVSIAIFFYGNTKDLTDRIGHAKDILTVVIGVLGTIMGFYFGSAVDGRINIANITLRPPEAVDKPGKLQARILGGSSPYQYTITFEGVELPAISKSSPNGVVDEPIDFSKLAGKTTVTITLAVTDSRGIQGHAVNAVQVPDVASALAIKPLGVTPASAKAGASFRLSTAIAGGVPPYSIKVTRTDSAGASTEWLASKATAATVAEQVTVPANAVKGKGKLVVTVNDSKGASRQESADFAVDD
jgi:hypothetical protein